MEYWNIGIMGKKIECLKPSFQHSSFYSVISVLSVAKISLLFFADLPGDVAGAVLTVSLGVGAGAAFLAIPEVVFLADGKGFAIRMVEAIHGHPAGL
jgi:hypothetical protein